MISRSGRDKSHRSARTLSRRVVRTRTTAFTPVEARYCSTEAGCAEVASRRCRYVGFLADGKSGFDPERRQSKIDLRWFIVPVRGLAKNAITC